VILRQSALDKVISIATWIQTTGLLGYFASKQRFLVLKKEEFDMKLVTLSKFAGASVLALSLAVLPSTLSASAQTGAPDATGTQTETQTQAVDADRDFDWGWLGLLGLIGLAGLAKRPRESVTAYRNPDEVRTGSRY
jgi:hypothetical protein